MNNTTRQSPLYGKLYKEHYSVPFDKSQQSAFRLPDSIDDSPDGLMIFRNDIKNLLEYAIRELSILQDISINDTTRGILVRNYIQNRLDLARKGIPDEITDKNEILALNNLIQEYNLDTISRKPNTTLQGHAEEILTTLDPTLQGTLY